MVYKEVYNLSKKKGEMVECDVGRVVREREKERDNQSTPNQPIGLSMWSDLSQNANSDNKRVRVVTKTSSSSNRLLAHPAL